MEPAAPSASRARCNQPLPERARPRCRSFLLRSAASPRLMERTPDALERRPSSLDNVEDSPRTNALARLDVPPEVVHSPTRPQAPSLATQGTVRQRTREDALDMRPRFRRRCAAHDPVVGERATRDAARIELLPSYQPGERKPHVVVFVAESARAAPSTRFLSLVALSTLSQQEVVLGVTLPESPGLVVCFEAARPRTL